MKKYLSFVLSAVLSVVLLSGSVFADAPTTSSSNNDAPPTDTLGTVGQTSFSIQNDTSSPQNTEQPSNVKPFASGFGVILCETTSAGGAICDWTITVTGDTINYSNVSVKFEKWNSTYFRWETVSTQTFNYSVPNLKTIRDQASIGMLKPGFYRATLGGTFTCVEKGVYVATANDPSNFTIE